MPETTMHLRIPSREVALAMAEAVYQRAGLLIDTPGRHYALLRLADALMECPADVTPMTRRELVAQVEDVRNRTAYLEGTR